MESAIRWIWDKENCSERNKRLCFRKKFTLKDTKGVMLDITADARYILYVNGVKVGFGPARYWDFEQSYDTYDISDYLMPGENVLAVLVCHFGFSTFQYISGKAGLYVDCRQSGRPLFQSDETFYCLEHLGYYKNAMPAAVQQAFSEIYDAKFLDENWVTAAFDDTGWKSCVSFDKETKLIPRDIPFLNSEPVSPKRVESHKIVSPVNCSIDVFYRRILTENTKDINPWIFKAYCCLNLFSKEETEGEIIFTGSTWQSPQGDVKINGRLYAHKDGTLKNDGYHIPVKLDRGENLLVIRMDNKCHGSTTRMCFDFEGRVTLKPFPEYDTKCIMLGPFEAEEVIGDIPCGNPSVMQNREGFEKSFADCFAQLEELKEYIRPLKKDEYFENTVYGMSAVKKEIKELDIVSDTSNLLFQNPGFTLLSPSSPGDHELILDFGREITGFIRFDITAKAGTIFDFYLFEYMNGGEIQYTMDLDNSLRYTAKEGRQQYQSVTRRGFRYLMVTVRNQSQDVKIHHISAELSAFPVSETGQFHSSSERLNKIWEMCSYTTKLCMEDTFVDCPAYEQTYWVGDSRNEALIAYYAFGSYDLARRCLSLVPKSADQSPYLVDQVPSGWLSVIPNWTFFFVTACYEYWYYTADIGFVKENINAILNTLKKYAENLTKENLLYCEGFNLFDWAPMDMPFYGVITHENAIYVKALRDATKLSRLAGKEEDAVWCRQTADKVSASVAEHLWDDKKKAFIDCIHKDGTRSEIVSQQTNMLVYLYGCYQEKQEKYLEEILLNCPEGAVQIGSPFALFFYLEALVKLGEINLAVSYMEKWWGMMLDHGATTAWETFPNLNSLFPTRSHCHAWSAAPVFFLSAYVLGVRCGSEGFKKIIISPTPCGLAFAKGSVPLPEGRADVAWRLEEKRLIISVKVPENYTVEYQIDKKRLGIDEVVINAGKDSFCG